MLQGKLINEKKYFSRNAKNSNELPIHLLYSTGHDIMQVNYIYYINTKKLIINIVQTKYLALDFHEERKWKPAFASIYAKDAKNEIDEKKKKKKIDDLYKKCYSIYFTINHGNNSSEFSDDNKNELNDYLKPKLNEYNNL